MAGIDSRQFEIYKSDETYLDEWTKQVIEKILPHEKDSSVLKQLKELLKLADK